MAVRVNAQSSYGVLRPLGANLGAVVRTKDNLIEFISNEAYLVRMETPPTAHLKAEHIQASHTVQGHPVTK